jgi:hypothetical protein
MGMYSFRETFEKTRGFLPDKVLWNAVATKASRFIYADVCYVIRRLLQGTLFYSRDLMGRNNPFHVCLSR